MNRTVLIYLLTECGPVLAFFVCGQLTSFNTAVGVLMGGTLLATLISWQLERHIPVFPILSALIVLIGGGITLLSQNPNAVIFADTVYYGLSALILGYTLWRRELLLKLLFKQIFAITDRGWWVLSRNWLVVLCSAAIANEIVRLFATTDFWIDYRFYKTIAILMFACSQFWVSRTYRIAGKSNAWGLRTMTPVPVEQPAKHLQS